MSQLSSHLHKDAHIRLALRQKKLQRFDVDENSLVIDELGLAHARRRIDVAVLNGCLHGYEIKSERDTLERLQSQLATYRRTLGRLTYVCSSKHVERTLELTPDWCGVIEAERGRRGSVLLKTLRRTRSNPEIEPIMLAHLLWRDEVVSILRERRVEGQIANKRRLELYEILSDLLSLRELTAEIRRAFLKRENWRDRPVRLSYGD